METVLPQPAYALERCSPQASICLVGLDPCGFVGRLNRVERCQILLQLLEKGFFYCESAAYEGGEDELD
jgi:hypothetical protein